MSAMWPFCFLSAYLRDVFSSHNKAVKNRQELATVEEAAALTQLRRMLRDDSGEGAGRKDHAW